MDRFEQIRAFLPTVAPTLAPSEFHERAVALLCATFVAAPEQLAVDWTRVQWFGVEGGVEVPVYKPELATTDPGTLSRLVFAAHDMCVRVELRPMRFHTLRFILRPRPYRPGSGRSPWEHPTLASALQKWRGLPWGDSLARDAFESDVPLSGDQRQLDAVGRYADPTVQLWFRIWEMGAARAQAAAEIRYQPRPTFPNLETPAHGTHS